MLLAAGSFHSTNACPCGEVKLLTDVKESDYSGKIGLAYAKTAAYQKDFDTAIRGAYDTLRKHKGESNVAVISDIDETLLDNMPFFREFGAGDSEPNWDEFFKWIDESRAPALKKTAQMLASARKQGVSVFLITGREEKYRRGTINNLLRRGIAYDGLYMRTNGEKGDAAKYKSAVRQKIEDMGYKIIVNIGDQYSDLALGYSEDCEKLPNKLYYIP